MLLIIILINIILLTAIKKIEMATDINGGQPSKTIEEIIFKNMMKIMVSEFNK